ncbi:hypothetical protein BCR35DRAFT_276278, partial [Leucosporidium creatinivorum]
MSSASTSCILLQLADYRTETRRHAHKVVQLGQHLIQRGWASSSTDELWTVLEQVATAAVESGQLSLADVCASRLATQFPDSPRVALLQGVILEGKGEVLEAKRWYEQLLDKDEHNTNIRKRLITLHLTSPSSSSTTLTKGKSSTSTSAAGGLSREKGLEMLVEHLDTVYNDIEGWSQLASVYAGMGLYPQSLSALSHLLLLAPHNPFHLLHHAETAYTLGDYPLAWKEFSRVVEMCEGVTKGDKEGSGGAGRRAAVGAKLVSGVRRSL